jgi:hypothetical protein
MSWRQAQEVALASALLATLLLLFEHINYFIRHSPG